MYQREEKLVLEFQNEIEHAPVKPQALYKQACTNDDVTIERWRNIWVDQIKKNKERLNHGTTTFKENGVGKLFGQYARQPVIIAGAGPSLKINAHHLKDRKGIPLISCLHNYHFFEDSGISPEYYVSLDAGPVTIEEVSEGGTKSEKEYWDSTAKHTLLAYIGSHPDLLSKWQGKIFYFNCPIPDLKVLEEVRNVEKFNTFVGNGGNVLGACFYIAKALMGANPICFIGADFCFQNRKFHPWDSKYDKDLGVYMRAFDIFGNSVKTWASYYNFKCWFDYICETVPGLYINATEGGCLGAYMEGNISSIKQMGLENFLNMYSMYNHMEDQCKNPETDELKLLF